MSSYQPMAFGCRCSKVSVGTGFISISVMFSLDSTGRMVICLEATCSQKKWYFILMCLVHGFMAGEFANVRAALLFLNSLHLTVGWDHSLMNPFLIISSTRSMMALGRFFLVGNWQIAVCLFSIQSYCRNYSVWPWCPVTP